MKKLQWKPLLACLAIPLAVGGLSAWLSRDGMKAFANVKQPPLSPPMWVFPVVWTVLFLLMGFASYLIWRSPLPQRNGALGLYAAQLAVNFLWPIFFFQFGLYLFSFFWLLLLWGLIWLCLFAFRRINTTAGWLLVPYLLWTTFALYLNFGVYWLNR